MQQIIEAIEKTDDSMLKDFIPLFKKSNDINAKNDYGTTALMCASACDEKEVVETLLNAGANVNAKNNHGWTALMWASDRGHNEIVEMLKKSFSQIW